MTRLIALAALLTLALGFGSALAPSSQKNLRT